MRWIIAALALTTAAGCAGRKEHVIVMKPTTYEPETLTVESGDLVVWRNDDANPHTAVAPGRFDSGQVAPGGSFRVTLTKTGELPYACTLHPMMKGKLIVK